AQILSLIALITVTPLSFAQVTPGKAEDNGLIPRGKTFDINTDFNNTASESLGVGIAANGNVLIGWEDDGFTDITDFESVWSLFDSTGHLLTSTMTITNHDGSQSINSTYLSYFRSNGSPTPGYTA